jgi:hypothetical protein
MSNAAPIEPGLLTTRAEMKARFGGGTQSGIEPSKSTPNILIYVDHESGQRFGYEDGWLAEEDEQGPVFEYTGQGSRGDQTFLGLSGSRNAAVLYHADEGRSLRVFMAAGRDPRSRSAAKRQRYIGEFALDTEQPYTVREANDEAGERRLIIVFRLRPTGAYERINEDAVARATETDAHRVTPAVLTRTMTEPKMIDPQQKRAWESRRAAQPSLIADLRQAELRATYLEWLTSQQHEIYVYQVKITGTSRTLKTDLYDATTHELYSIRGDSSRPEVHTAIGFLKDYARHIRPRNLKLSTLLPGRPEDDLLDLLHTEGIDLVYPSEDGDGYTRSIAS